MISRVRVLIIGRVQGVWFRASTKQKAEQLGLKGWVRNTSDGHVEAVFEGDEEILKDMIEWCKTGPRLAKVHDVQIKNEKPTDEFDQFNIRY